MLQRKVITTEEATDTIMNRFHETSNVEQFKGDCRQILNAKKAGQNELVQRPATDSVTAATSKDFGHLVAVNRAASVVNRT